MAAVVFLLLPCFALAQEYAVEGEPVDQPAASSEQAAQQSQDEIFEAKVLEVVKEQESKREDGSTYMQQNLKLKGLTGDMKGKEFEYNGIGSFDVLSSNYYKKGDKVLAIRSRMEQGEENFYIMDYIRRGNIYLLTVIFCLIIILIGKFKGLKALISLIVSFAIIMKFIIPQISSGANPLFICIVGSLLILLVVIYLTEGFDRKAHLAIASILLGLIFTGIISIIFTDLCRLTGMAQEESMYLIGIGKGILNFKGMLLAGIIIGTLGVLDDVVISQLYAVEEIRKIDPNIRGLDLYKKASNIGIAHISSMTNTLFLAYAGASLPLLLLFTVHEAPFLNFSQIINSELIATEIVRSLVGSIGLALAVPISTLLGVIFIKGK